MMLGALFVVSNSEVCTVCDLQNSLTSLSSGFGSTDTEKMRFAPCLSKITQLMPPPDRRCSALHRLISVLPLLMRLGVRPLPSHILSFRSRVVLHDWATHIPSYTPPCAQSPGFQLWIRFQRPVHHRIRRCWRSYGDSRSTCRRLDSSSDRCPHIHSDYAAYYHNRVYVLRFLCHLSRSVFAAIICAPFSFRVQHSNTDPPGYVTDHYFSTHCSSRLGRVHQSGFPIFDGISVHPDADRHASE